MNFGDFVLFFIGGWILIVVGILGGMGTLTLIGCASVTFSFALILYIVGKAAFVTTVHGFKQSMEKSKNARNRE